MLFRKVDFRLGKRFTKTYLYLVSLLLFCGIIYLNGYFKTRNNTQDFINTNFGGNIFAKLEDYSNRRHNRNLQHMYGKESAAIKDLYHLNVYAEHSRGSNSNKGVRKDEQTILKSKERERQISKTRGRKKTASKKRLPNAIIIGVKKGGTRALLEFLRAHPYVRATGPEPHFFDKHYEKGLEWYRNLMPKSEPFQLTIEKTPAYFVTRDVPSRVYNMSESVKLILVVRDPVTRCVSDFTQMTSRFTHPQSFEKLVLTINRTAVVDTSRTIVRVGMYSDHLKNWLNYFPLEQIHIVDGENLVKDPGNEMRKLQNFLNIPIVIGDKNFYFNKLRGFPCIKRQNGMKPHCLDETKGRKHPFINPKTLQILRTFYEPFNRIFSNLTGQNFSWT